MKKIRISGLGCTLLDYVYNGVDFNSSGFRSYSSRLAGDGGLSPGDLVFTEDLERFAGECYEKIHRDIVGEREPDTFNVGGPAIVSIIHAAQLLDELAEIRFFASLGRDRVAERLLGILSQTPVSAREFVYRTGPTPFTHVLSDPGFHGGRGERTFINSLGAAGELGPEDLPPDFLHTDILVLGGTALVPGIHDRLDEILEKAQKQSYVIVNTVFDFRNEKKAPGVPWPLCKDKHSFSRIDLLIMDRQEALKISGGRDLEESVDYFAGRGLPAFIITDGAEPVILYSTTLEKGTVLRMPVSKVLSEGVVSGKSGGDTTGAGDNFVGGVIFSIARQLQEGRIAPDLIEAVKWGIVSGGFACTYMGGTYLEKWSGEKLDKIQKYFDLYTQQLKGE